VERVVSESQRAAIEAQLAALPQGASLGQITDAVIAILQSIDVSGVTAAVNDARTAFANGTFGQDDLDAIAAAVEALQIPMPTTQPAPAPPDQTAPPPTA
jgi:hypothetical protein